MSTPPRASRPSFVHGDWVQVYVDPDDDPDPDRRGPGYIRVVEREGAPGVVVLPLAGDHVGLVTVYRRAVGAYCLEIPRGFGGEGTGPRSDAARELAEETGLKVDEADLVELGSIHINSGLLAGEVVVFAAVFDQPVESSPSDEKEVARFGWSPVALVLQQVRDGRIKDAMTHAALLKAACHGLIALG